MRNTKICKPLDLSDMSVVLSHETLWSIIHKTIALTSSKLTNAVASKTYLSGHSLFETKPQILSSHLWIVNLLNAIYSSSFSL